MNSLLRCIGRYCLSSTVRDCAISMASKYEYERIRKRLFPNWCYLALDIGRGYAEQQHARVASLILRLNLCLLIHREDL